MRRVRQHLRYRVANMNAGLTWAASPREDRAWAHSSLPGTSPGLVKQTAGAMWQGTYETLEFESAQDLIGILSRIATNQAISASLCTGGMHGEVTTKKNTSLDGSAVSRTKEHFNFARRAGILILDYDPPIGGAALSRTELWEELLQVCPGIGKAAAVWWCSGSSYIFNGETNLIGLRGQRLYIMIQDSSDTERAGEVLGKRLWLNGKGHIQVSESGQRLVRSTFDLAMFEAARLDFIGGAVCQPPLSQRRPPAFLINDGTWLHTRTAMPDLSIVEEQRYLAILNSAKDGAEADARMARDRWVESRLQGALKRLSLAEPDSKHAHDRATQTLRSALSGVLLGDFEIELYGINRNCPRQLRHPHPRRVHHLPSPARHSAP